MSLIVGLTGNIGSGKSMVCKVFSSLNIPIFYADEEAKNLLYAEHIIKKITEQFGEIILDEDSTIDKKKLASLAFSDKGKLKALNGIIHPEVYNRFKVWKYYNRNHPYLIMEAAILFESNFDKYVDISINIHADIELRLSRVTRRDGTNKKDILARMNNQMEDTEKQKRANHTIFNNESQLVIPQILSIHNELLKKGSN